jgi:glycerol-3-phosphate acyltransferase PlsY
MMSVLIYIGVMILAYFIGNLSSARFIAKTFRHLKICKIGTGRPDTENIYKNVSKSLGILVGLLDFLKVYVFLALTDYLFSYFEITKKLATPSHIFIFGVMMILGHVFPLIHKFIGGRGIFHYIAVMAYFAFYPLVIVAVLIAVTLLIFKQLRFSQYMIVLLPPLVNLFFNSTKAIETRLILLALFMGVLNFIGSKQRGEL